MSRPTMPSSETPLLCGTTATWTPALERIAAFSIEEPPSLTKRSSLSRRSRGVMIAIAPARPRSSATVQPSRQPSMIGRKLNSCANCAMFSRSARSEARKRAKDAPVRMLKVVESTPFLSGSFSSLSFLTSSSQERYSRRYSLARTNFSRVLRRAEELV